MTIGAQNAEFDNVSETS